MNYLNRILLSFTVIIIFSCSNNDDASNDENVQSDDLELIDGVKASNSNISLTYVDESVFINGFNSANFKAPHEISLNRTATTAGYNQVYGFNIPTANQVTGFKWNTGDQDTEEWRPQGITGFSSNGKDFLLVTWYGVSDSQISGIHNEHKGVRVALVDITDMSNIKYRHIILVQDKANITDSDLFSTPSTNYTQLDKFAPVTIHAGGVSYFDGKIYVASTSLGIRVFDINQFIPATTGSGLSDTIGENNSGDYIAYNYAYILPQIGYYSITNADPYSCIALGKDINSNNRLYTGQYLTSSSSQDPVISGFNINPTGTVSALPCVEEIEAKDNASSGNSGPVYNMQGIFRNVDTSIMTATGKSEYYGSTARLIRYYDGDTSGTRFRWPHGAEDLFFDQSTEYLWNLTEYETSKYNAENRCVFAVRYSDYN